jgi:hypothetical protein
LGLAQRGFFIEQDGRDNWTRIFADERGSAKKETATAHTTEEKERKEKGLNVA